MQFNELQTIVGRGLPRRGREDLQMPINKPENLIDLRACGGHGCKANPPPAAPKRLSKNPAVRRRRKRIMRNTPRKINWGAKRKMRDNIMQ